MSHPILEALAPSYLRQIDVRVEYEASATLDAIAIPVTTDSAVPESLGVGLAELERAGFTPDVGAAIAFPSSVQPVQVAVGVGSVASLCGASLRDAAAAFARAVPRDARLGTRVPSGPLVSLADAAAAIVEGVLLSRYRFDLRSIPHSDAQVEELVLIAPPGERDEVAQGARRGLATARAALVARDLATAPAVMLTAERIADVAVAIGAETGLTVEVFGKQELIALNCGGLLGVNRGSVNAPTMVVVNYLPEGVPTGHLALVGKGVMYDSGGINLKPGDLSHSQMKNDMTGAGDILGAMSVLKELGCQAQVTGYLMCTDNMPSGSAMQLGDVLVIHGGKTVEVVNTDAEGRLVMADALVLAAEAGADAIVDIATLTGACLRTFGTEVAGVMGNSSGLISQVERAGDAADEQVWELPLIPRYRSQLNSDIADIKNLGGPNAGAITAGLFLQEFVGGVPWAHIDIAGTAQAEATSRWIPRGPTAFGARLLVELALNFEQVD